ncbi:MAG: hypothetical protein GW760_06315 [Legionella sp.]|nr:hypothetical protein [Legionella sp.]
MAAIYNNAKIYSLRDGDGINNEISDDGIVVKFRLCCRAAENLLLTDEVLESCNISWGEFQEKIDSWLINNERHKHASSMQDFKNQNYPRKNFDLKAIRNDLLSLLESQLDWEILVGKNIATFITNNCPPNQHSENSISAYLGKKLVDMLISNSPDKIIPKERCNVEIVEPA